MKEIIETNKVETISEGEIIELITEGDHNTLLDPFVNKDILNHLLYELEKEVVSRWDFNDNTDPNTEKGRKTLISRARSIASVSARLDEIGKQEVSKLKELPKKVDAGRRQAREFFEKWKESVREPVAKWEAKQAEVLKLAQVILDHEQALIDHELWKTEQKEKEELSKEIREIIYKSFNNHEPVNLTVNESLTIDTLTTGHSSSYIGPKLEDKHYRNVCLCIMDSLTVDYDVALVLAKSLDNAGYLNKDKLI